MRLYARVSQDPKIGGGQAGNPQHVRQEQSVLELRNALRARGFMTDNILEGYWDPNNPFPNEAPAPDSQPWGGGDHQSMSMLDSTL